MIVNYTKDAIILAANNSLTGLQPLLEEESTYNKDVLLTKADITLRTNEAVALWMDNNDLEECVRDCIKPVTKPWGWGVTEGGDFCERLFDEKYPDCPLNTGIMYEFANRYTKVGDDWISPSIVHFSINTTFLWEELTNYEKGLLLDDYPLKVDIVSKVNKITKIRDDIMNMDTIVVVGLSCEERELLGL